VTLSAATAAIARQNWLERDAIMPNRYQVTHPALALCSGEHVYPAADLLMSEHAPAMKPATKAQ
jgi:hypothetical protein